MTSYTKQIAKLKLEKEELEKKQEAEEKLKKEEKEKKVQIKKN
ncbi:hypothetical protein [Flavobacterium segetis]|nr:hypothetical protein [Flavobacterium segetis]